MITTSSSSNSRVKRNGIIFLIMAGGIMWWPLLSKLFGSSPSFLRDLGFVSGPAGTSLAWALGLLVAVLYTAFAIRNIPLVRSTWISLSIFKLIGILAAVSAAVVEEAFFRRLIMDWLMQAGWSGVIQVLVSGLVFGLAHGIWGIMTGRFSIGFRIVIATGTLGIALGIVYLVGGRSLAPVIVSHFLITASIQPGITFAAFSGQMRR